jgi:hypothetical protein
MRLFIIGDSHTIRLRLSGKYDIPVKECYWAMGYLGPENYEEPKCEYEHLLQGGELPVETYFSAHKGQHAWGTFKVLNELNLCLKEAVKPDMLILPYFGYIDSKIQLVKYKDPKEAVVRYMDAFFTTFPNNKIRFIEPIPQFVNNIGTGSDIYNFEDRYPMHKEFVKHLREQSKIRGLENPISPEQILGVDRFDESYECHECAYCLMPESKGIKWDHLKPKYNKILLDAIMSEYSNK